MVTASCSDLGSRHSADFVLLRDVVVTMLPGVGKFAHAKAPELHQTDEHGDTTSGEHDPNHYRLLLWPVNIAHDNFVARLAVAFVRFGHDPCECINVKISSNEKCLDRSSSKNLNRKLTKANKSDACSNRKSGNVCDYVSESMFKFYA